MKKHLLNYFIFFIQILENELKQMIILKIKQKQQLFLLNQTFQNHDY